MNVPGNQYVLQAPQFAPDSGSLDGRIVVRSRYMNCVFDGFLCGDGKWLQVIAFSAVGKTQTTPVVACEF